MHNLPFINIIPQLQEKAKPIARLGRKATGPYSRIAGLPGRAVRFVFFRSSPPKDSNSAILTSSMEGTRDAPHPDLFH